MGGSCHSASSRRFGTSFSTYYSSYVELCLNMFHSLPFAVIYFFFFCQTYREITNQQILTTCGLQVSYLCACAELNNYFFPVGSNFSRNIVYISLAVDNLTLVPT